MARIGKAEHARILHLADAEGRRVADIAAEYGCSAANIYALLGKLRRGPPLPPVQGEVAVPEPAPSLPPASVAVPSRGESVVDLFAVTAGLAEVEARAAAPVPVPVERTPAAPARSPETAKRPATSSSSRAPVPAERAPAPRGMALAKPGYGLVMRSAEGEDSLAPFRSLEDLLGAIKPILRAAARSAEPVWFCIQPVDLAALDDDAT